jgi:hypothetical protein
MSATENCPRSSSARIRKTSVSMRDRAGRAALGCMFAPGLRRYRAAGSSAAAFEREAL